MFTATMTGCTFAIGSATPTGDRLVGHFNIQDPSGSTYVDEMAFAARTIFGRDATLLDKSQYMIEHGATGAPSQIRATTKTTTFDYYSGQSWHYYHQRSRQTGNRRFEIIDVRPIGGLG
jgi:hypothetical protein